MQAAGIPTCREMSYTDAQSFQLETVSHQKAKKKKKAAVQLTDSERRHCLQPRPQPLLSVNLEALFI